MLRLKEIELLGFKSFADRTRLACDGATAGVVGPNGCGKSNLADAVSWVLGEQSPRLLRGERMADVIFNGSRTRPPTGLAEVSITLVESAGTLRGVDELEKLMGIAGSGSSGEPAPGNGGVATASASGNRASRPCREGEEIKVTRRLFRSGESEYLLNGENCRLRDIQDLFMGTGLGPESYAIIEQGRIGLILSSKPADRRAIIEEAAGVSKFKSRKRLAEAKLESARGNLARINDILEEIAKQVNSLKRQASKASRYKELHQELRGRQARVFASRLVALEAECARLKQDFTGIQEDCDRAAASLEELDRMRGASARQFEDSEEELKRIREAVAASELESERMRSRAEQARREAAALEARAAEAAQEHIALEQQAVDLERGAGEKEQHAAGVQAEWLSAQQAASELAMRHSDLAHALASAEAIAETARREMLLAVSRASEVRNEAVKAEEMCHSAAREMAHAEAERAAIEDEHAEAQADLATARAAHHSSEAGLSEMAQSAANARKNFDAAENVEAGLASEIAGLSQDLSQHSARRQALEESLARHAYTTDSVRRLLAPAARTAGFQPLGVLADFLEVAGGYEAVVEEFLKNELDSVVVEQHDDARRGIALLESEGGGRSTFFVRHVPSNGHSPGPDQATLSEARARSGIVAPLSEYVRFEAGLGLNGTPPFPVLARSFVVEDSSAAERLAAEFPTCHFLTRSGEHYHHRSVSGGKAAEAGPLALRREFRELDRRVAELEAQLADAQARWTGAKEQTAERGEALRRLTAEQANADKQTMLSGEKVRQASEAAARASSHIATVEREAARLAAECEAAIARRQTVQAELQSARESREESEKTAAATADSARELRQAVDEITRTLTEAQVRSSALDERWRAAEAERSRAAAEAERARQRLGALLAQAEAWNDGRRGLEIEAAEAAAMMESADAAQQSLRRQLESVREQSQQARARRDDLSPQVDAERVRLAERKERRTQIEVAQARADSALDHHARQCREELGAEPDALRAGLDPAERLDGEALDLAEAEVREIKAKIERLGPLNMMALEELQEAEGRLAFLDAQRQDLLASIADTVKTIHVIDDASRRKFIDAFRAINAYFGESFRTLFGGGSGEMRLSDEADPESGIDIVAEPPGKRLQNVLLLSGGEKALTALALLIGVFRFTPSPFCILDEVDAPLDEANVVRFARMIQSMSEATQFILITHSKRTMEMCSVLYGATMEEPGVSKLVSVRLEAAEPQAAAVSA
ncbi:MAG: chromosome segregation protein SMC [Terriglobia bacterium]